MARIFVSHCSKDKDWVKLRIVDALRARGIETWYSGENIKAADDWSSEIWRGLAACDWLAVVLTPEAVKSKWVKYEVIWGFENRLGRIIPILAGKCRPEELHLPLIGIQYVDFTKHPQSALDEIRRRVLGTTPIKIEQVTRPPPPVRTPPAPRPARIWMVPVFAILFLSACAGLVYGLTTASPVVIGTGVNNIQDATTGDATVYFDTGSDFLKIQYKDMLKRISARLINSPGLRVQIIGKVDDDENMNMLGGPKLSEDRADTVRTSLIEAGVAPWRIQAEGQTQGRPKSVNQDAILRVAIIYIR